MINQLLYTLLFLTGFWSIIYLSELLYNKLSVSAEITRKIAHVLATLSSLSFLLLFQSHWYVLIIAIACFLLLFISSKKDIYKSINSVERETSGSYILPVSIYLLYLTFELMDDKKYFILPILILGISDPLAGLAGSSLNKKTKQIKVWGYNFQKTYLGSALFFLTTLVLSVWVFYYFNFLSQDILILGFYFAFVTTIVEMVSKRGLDNITVPLATVVLLLVQKIS